MVEAKQWPAFLARVMTCLRVRIPDTLFHRALRHLLVAGVE